VIPLLLILNLNLPRKEHGLAIRLEEPFQRLSCVLLARIWRPFIRIKFSWENGVHVREQTSADGFPVKR